MMECRRSTGHALRRSVGGLRVVETSMVIFVLWQIFLVACRRKQLNGSIDRLIGREHHPMMRIAKRRLTQSVKLCSQNFMILSRRGYATISFRSGGRLIN